MIYQNNPDKIKLKNKKSGTLSSPCNMGGQVGLKFKWGSETLYMTFLWVDRYVFIRLCRHMCWLGVEQKFESMLRMGISLFPILEIKLSNQSFYQKIRKDIHPDTFRLIYKDKTSIVFSHASRKPLQHCSRATIISFPELFVVKKLDLAKLVWPDRTIWK